MEKIPHDFKELLELLNSHKVEYLVVRQQITPVHSVV